MDTGFSNNLRKLTFFMFRIIIQKKILEKNSFENVHISGDSRFTSVINTLNKNKRVIKY